MYKDNYKYIGESILRRCAFCWMNLEELSMIVKNTDNSNIATISKIANYRYKDIDYFEFFNNPIYNFRHYTTLLINNIVFGNYKKFNNTNQYITYTEFYPVYTYLRKYLFNFIFEVEKNSVDLNSTLWECNNGKSYIKILYNNQGIIYKINENANEKIINLTSSLLNRKSNLMIYCLYTLLLSNIIVKVYLDGILLSEINDNNPKTIFTESFHQSYIGNNQTKTEPFKWKILRFFIII